MNLLPQIAIFTILTKLRQNPELYPEVDKQNTNAKTNVRGEKYFRWQSGWKWRAGYKTA